MLCVTPRSLSSLARQRSSLDRSHDAVLAGLTNTIGKLSCRPVARRGLSAEQSRLVARPIGDHRLRCYISAGNAGGAMMTSDLWALVATIGLLMGQLSIASILTLRQLGGTWVAGPRDEPRAVRGVA